MESDAERGLSLLMPWLKSFTNMGRDEMRPSNLLDAVEHLEAGMFTTIRLS